MSGKVFGVSIATIVIVLLTAVAVRKFGNAIPLINKL